MEYLPLQVRLLVRVVHQIQSERTGILLILQDEEFLGGLWQG